MDHRKAIVGVYILFTFLAIGICQSAFAKRDKKVTIKIGSYVTPNSEWGRAVKHALGNIEEETEGMVVVKHMHSGVLGSNQSMLEQVLNGGIHGAGVDTSTLATIVPAINVLELPFLFRDRDEAYYLIDNVISPHIKKLLNEKGLETSSIMEVGFMDFVMSGPVHKPEDLKSMKIGSWESPVHVSFWKAVGGNPIPLQATEVISAYARGVVDSGSNSPSALIAWDRFFGAGLDRGKIYITRTQFTYHAGIIVMNKNFMDRIPAEYKEIVLRELDSMTGEIRNDIGSAVEPSYKKLDDLGYHVIDMTPEEKQVFVDRSQVVYDQFRDVIGADFLDEVLDARAKYRAEHPE